MTSRTIHSLLFAGALVAAAGSLRAGAGEPAELPAGLAAVESALAVRRGEIAALRSAFLVDCGHVPESDKERVADCRRRQAELTELMRVYELDRARLRRDRLLFTMANDPRYAPVPLAGGDEETKCNVFVQDYANTFGYSGFAGLQANQIVAKVSKDPTWVQITDYAVAQRLANEGQLVVAGWTNPIAGGHGHVAAIVPGSLERSGTWGADVPRIAQAGPTGGVFAGGKLSRGFGVEKRDALVMYALQP